MQFFATRSLFLLATLQVIASIPQYGTGSDYCAALLVRLNTFGAKLDAKVCVGTPQSSGYSSSDIGKMSCNDLVLAVGALGIKVKGGLCSNTESETYTNGSGGGNDNTRGSYQGGSSGGNSDYGSTNGGGGKLPACNGIVAKLRALGIDIDANVCLGSSGGGSTYPPLSGGSTCPDLVADLGLLGIPVKAQLCLGGNGTNGHCTIGANVGASNILGVDLCVGRAVGNNGGNTGYSSNGSNPTCQGICDKVKLLGVKVDAKICLSGKNSGPNAPVLSNKSGCSTLVANAKLLGIVNVDLALCLKVNVNLGLKRRSDAKRISVME